MTPERAKELTIQMINMVADKKYSSGDARAKAYQMGYLIGFITRLAADDSRVANELATRVKRLKGIVD